MLIIILFVLFTVTIFLSIFRNILYIILNAIAAFFDSVVYHIRRIFNPKGGSDSNASTTARFHSRKKDSKKKIFDSNDGEYVDFEEVK